MGRGAFVLMAGEVSTTADELCTHPQYHPTDDGGGFCSVTTGEALSRWEGLYSPFPPTGATSICSGMPSSNGRAWATNGRTSGLARAAV